MKGCGLLWVNAGRMICCGWCKRVVQIVESLKQDVVEVRRDVKGRSEQEETEERRGRERGGSEV